MVLGRLGGVITRKRLRVWGVGLRAWGLGIGVRVEGLSRV